MTSRPPRMWVPTTVYVLVAFVASGILVAAQSATGPNPELLELVQFAPAVAVAVVLFAWRGRWVAPFEVSLWRPAAAPTLTAAASVLVILAFPAVVLVALGGNVSVAAIHVESEPIGLLVLAQCVGACGEEVGWRGFLQPYLRSRYSVLVTGMLVGTVWGVWHVQVFAAGPAYASGFLLSTITMSVLLAVLLDPFRSGNLLIATLFHAVANLGLLTFSDAGGREPLLWTLMAVAAACCATAILAVRKFRGVTDSAPRESAVSCSIDPKLSLDGTCRDSDNFRC
ncbi:type II CAAX endopeptidase family protein [Rhodococcus sp. IEGM 1366]|uniref:CPBP family intramembrane glutamic endopeptidase n=1 Tax=Rhodococcus sp. IEGM 1366 TaxID=3082223 RepID=UPI0029546546|nr:type II CAAX endopeptidase family protein [Rhodococcus sp. IEGM 1366]MDV8071319.1 type II CAAX endopeptidase family protein [Rhodococcus sp. IEGM 1366]